jgi:hypothetical protein
MLPKPEVTEQEMLTPGVLGIVLAVIVDVCPVYIVDGFADTKITFGGTHLPSEQVYPEPKLAQL